MFLSLPPYMSVISEVAELACAEYGDAIHGHQAEKSIF